MEDVVIDLVAVAQDLPRRDKLAQAIFRLRDAHSARTDLTSADDFAHQLNEGQDEIAKSSVAGIWETVGLSLLYSAVIMYARATKSSSKHRRTFDIRDQLTPDELATHNMLCDLRDDAVAHFGPGGRYQGPAWQKEGAFLIGEPDGSARVMTASRRIVLHPSLIARLKAQSHRALILADRRVQELNSEVVELLAEIGHSDSTFNEKMLRNRISLADFFESTQASLDALAGQRLGQRRGSMRH
jgi:hypothetical protein